MKRKLLKQISTEWASNLWIGLEMLVVSIVVWYVADYMFVKSLYANQETGFDISDTYLIRWNTLAEEDPEFIPWDKADPETGELPPNAFTPDVNKRQLIRLIEANEDVEKVSLSSDVPYSWSYMGQTMSYVEPETNDTLRLSMRIIQATPGYIDVFRVPSRSGLTLDEERQALADGKMLISSDCLNDPASYYTGTMPKDNMKASELINRGLLYNGNQCAVGGLIPPVKRNHFDSSQNTAIVPKDLEGDIRWLNHIAVKVKPGVKDFAERFMDKARTSYNVGNLRVIGVQSFEARKRECVQSTTEEVWRRIYAMIFLLVNVFLGLLGTFWFRTQQRVSEVAVRMTYGATPAQIFKRLIGEGLLILTLITPLAYLGDWILAHNELTEVYYGKYDQWWRTLSLAACVYGVMAIMVVIGIWIPARRAMKTEPAIALKDE
ncbi:MAG: hypothetical protein LIO90_10455 [Bacteroidales bacterium]|nr:hypothetical protein [Bacteroidales bacterium]